MTILEALEQDIEAMPRAVRESSTAAIARSLAATLDEGPGARDAASVAKELRATIAELREMNSRVPSEVDPIDQLAARRQSTA